MTVTRVLVFQHLVDEHPGSLGVALRRHGATFQTVELDEGEVIPDLTDFDLLLVMGGPMDVWEEEAHPWLRDEKDAIRHWVCALERPFLGVCLGHQLLADAVGGAVGPMAKPEIGVMEFAVTASGSNDRIFSGLPDPLFGLQWHGAEVKELPTSATVLARNEYCETQAIRVGEVAWGVQFHVEASADTVQEWAKVPEYRSSLESSGLTMEWLETSVTRSLPTMAATTEVLANQLLTSVSLRTKATSR